MKIYDILISGVIEVKNIGRKNTQLILSGNVPKALLSLAIPIVINNFIQTMYNLTDTFWLGKLGTSEMAAISLVSPLQNIIVNFGQGITIAGSILISQHIGADDKKNAKSMANQIFVCAMLFSIVASILCILFSPFIVEWLGAEGIVKDNSITYLKIVLADLPFLFLINLFSAVHQSQGDTVNPMKLNMLGIIINMFLDPLLIMVFHWGIGGAALATMFAKVPCGIIAVLSLFNKNNEIHIVLKNFKFDADKIKKIVSVGLPTAIGGSTMQFGFLLMTKNVLVYGDGAMAAYGIGNKLNGIITMPANAIGSAVATIVGQNVGARQIKRAEKSYQIARNMAIVFLFVTGMIMSRHFMSEGIVKIFSHDENVISMATDFLSIMAFWCFTNGVYNSTIGLFNGAGNTLVTMLVEAARLWVFRFATLFTFSHFFGMAEESVWYSVVVSNGICAVILWVLYKLGLWKIKIKE